MSATGDPTFAVVSGQSVSNILRGRERLVVDLVRTAYLAHEEGKTVNPPSYFLRFEDRPANRIIALPASIGCGPEAVDGIKWISSVPGNIARGIPRASAITILNDPTTGYPYACMESSIISASRTAASAALAARTLGVGRPAARRLGIVGCGIISRYIHHYLISTGFEFDQVGVHDLAAEHAQGFSAYLEQATPSVTTTVHESVEDLLVESDLIVLATVAPSPYIFDAELFGHLPVVLNVSLRDVGTDVVLVATNVVDDVEHCLKADTSVHLTEQLTGSRSFLNGTLAQVMKGQAEVSPDRPVIFSPFGLGILDLAVAKYIYEELARSGALDPVPGFFHEMSRTGV